MNTPTPRTDTNAGCLIDPEEVVPADFARELERELATERETSRLLRVAMDARDEGYTQSRRRMSALESEVTAKGQAVRNLAEVISGQDKELECEREKVRVLRSALENLRDEQNGAPLEIRRWQWQLAMDICGLALATTEGAK